MPGLLQRGVQFGHAPATACSAFSGAAGSLPVSNAIWSRQRDDVSFDLLRKFWCELPTQARRELLRIDKQTLCDQAKKNLYCSRCHGLLLECYSQFVMYGKSLQQEFIGGSFPQKTTADVLADNESDDLQDPSVHPWGGLAATKDGMLTLLDCFICATSPDVIHKVFSSARQREHDRELLYPDACGGGGRGWISQGLANYGRVHGARETCALHTSRLSCDTLLDFWSALGDETRSALLHMKEDDFIERLMYRFDSKRFCRDCRRNVLREFKELKELKRLRKELYCTGWFCAADTAIQYEVSEDSVIVDWQHSFTNTSTYHHFEWAIGTAERKGDILDFEDVGMNGKVEVKGLDLSSFSACFITLRAWKLDGRCTELSVKAHALNGQKCVHRRLVVSDGFVTITKGDSIKCFFEHAEEVEEEEDDDIDKDGIELDGDGSRPQKHAKSPELAREFLLDAATVIFKEQVEKAFREGTARQNSHSLFISLTIKLLEDCVYVACKEIITLEKQIKLLEEEENEKREEEERKERRRNKEREKKQRRKDRLREKEKDREMKLVEEKPPCIDLSTSANTPLRSINDEPLARTLNFGDSLSDPRDDKDVLEPNSTDMTDDTSVYEDVDTVNLQADNPCRLGYLEEGLHFRESTGSFLLKQSKSSRRKLPFKRSALQDQPPKWYDKHRSVFRNVMSIQESNMKLSASSRCLSGGSRLFTEKSGRMDSRNCTDVRISDKFRSSQGRIINTSDSLPCRSNHTGEYRLVIDQYHISSMKGRREVKSAKAADSTGNLPRQLSHYSKHIHGGYIPDNRMLSKAKLVPGASTRDSSHTRQVWEPMDARKKHNRTNLGADLSSINTAEIHPSKETTFDKDERDFQSFDHEPSAEDNSPEFSRKTRKVDSSRFSENQLDQSQTKDSNNSDFKALQSGQNGFLSSEKSLCCSKDVGEDDHNPSSTTISMNDCCHSSSMISSSSDSCSSCPSEGDSNASFSSRLNVETSSTSDSEDASLQIDQRDTSICNGDTNLKNQNRSPDIKFGSRGYPLEQTNTTSGLPPRANSPRDESIKFDYSSGISSKFNVVPSQHHMLYAHNHLPIPTFPSELIGYENQNTIYWSDNGLLPFSQHHYMFPTPVGYGLPRNRSPGFAIQYNTLQPVTAAVFNSGQLHSFHGISKDCRAYPACLNDNGYREQVTEMAEPKTKFSEIKDHSLIEGTRNGATKSNESNNSFSLFHFGGPLVDATAYDAKTDCAKDDAGTILKAVESLDTISCSMEETKVEEYSLFATKNSSRFLFSSFTM